MPLLVFTHERIGFSEWQSTLPAGDLREGIEATRSKEKDRLIKLKNVLVIKTRLHAQGKEEPGFQMLFIKS